MDVCSNAGGEGTETETMICEPEDNLESLIHDNFLWVVSVHVYLYNKFQSRFKQVSVP